jgi:hypothetical protein
VLSHSTSSEVCCNNITLSLVTTPAGKLTVKVSYTKRKPFFCRIKREREREHGQLGGINYVL